MIRRFSGLVLVAFLSAACGQSAATPARPTLSIGNWTSVTITLVVNGRVVESVPPGWVEDPVTAAVPSRPWRVEAQLPNGRVVAMFTILATDDISSTSGKAARVDLACGRVDIWSGPPLLGPGSSPDPSKPCD